MVRVVGAGLGRTGTNSLKLALERLLGAPCYHMLEVFEHLDHVPVWTAALRGEAADLGPVLGGFAATVDWPGAGVWAALADRWPDAVVLLSTRADAEQWWRSASATILQSMQRGAPAEPAWVAWEQMKDAMMARFDPDWSEHDAAVAAYERHNAAVRAAVPADRLVEWQPGDGWAPLCAALGVEVPDEPFPHVNTTEQFRARAAASREAAAGQA